MINPKINVFIANEISNAKESFNAYFSMENSLGHLLEVAKDFYFISIGINEINEDIKNAKRFRVIIVHIIFLAIFTFIINLFSLSNYLYLFLKVDFLPGHFRIILTGIGLGISWMLAAKIDMILAEIKFNLSPLKVFYYLINNIKSKHKLTDLNYDELAFLSRIIQLVILNYGAPIVAVITMGFSILIAILSQKFIWILLGIYFTPIAIICTINFSIWMCIYLILFSYYKFIFDQIHSSIKSIVSNGKWNVINKRKEKQLINLIEEHKSVSNEIYKLNSMLRRSAAVMSIVLSTIRIIFLFVLINFYNNIFVNMMLGGSFLLLFVFGFGLTYLFSRQIKSAHQSNELIYSTLCRFNMRLQFRFKVIIFTILIFNLIISCYYF